MPPRLRTTGPLLVRASTAPYDLPVPTGLDPATAPVDDLTRWLETAWTHEGIREAVTVASPTLADRITALLSPTTGSQGGQESRAIRRAVRSLTTYLIRWQRRSTPFGLFAGVTTAAPGPAASRTVAAWQPVARPDAEWLRLTAGDLVDRSNPSSRLVVTANALVVERDGRLLLEPRRVGNDPETTLRDISIRATPLVRAALTAARAPVELGVLRERLAQAAQADGARRSRLRMLLAALLDQGFLLSSASPASTAGDGLDALLALTETTDASTRAALTRARELLDQYNAPGGSTAAHRRTLAAHLHEVAPRADTVLAVDTRFEDSLSVPAPVVREAERAASALLRMSTEPFGAVRWLDYHARFRARYGTGTPVPVTDLVSDAGLGYPTGFLGAPRTRPAWRQVTDRDAVVLNLLHRAALDGTGEVILSDADIAALTVGDPDIGIPPARCELGFTIHTPSPDSLERGDFQLAITAAPESSTSLTGRFTHLLDPADQARLSRYFAEPGTASDRPIVAQLVFRPRRTSADNVVRVPVLTGHVIVMDEHYDGPAARISVHDLAVTGDDDQLYLVQAATGRRIVPALPHALELTSRTPPLVRFLAEVADARCIVFRPFDLGAARTLDHTPRIRYGRTILTPARWILHTDQLTGPGSWWDRFAAWRARHRVPSRVVLAHAGTHLPLDLDQPLDRHLLEHLTAGESTVELYEQIPDGDGWLGRPTEVVAPMTPQNPPDRLPPCSTFIPRDRITPDHPATDTTQRRAARRPLSGRATEVGGLLRGGLVVVRIAGAPTRFDQLITEHLPRLSRELAATHPHRWWFTRLRDLVLPERDQYLQMTIDLHDPTAAAAALPVLARVLDDMAAAGLPSQASIHAHHPRTGIFGTGATLQTAYDVFATDALAAVEQVRLAHSTTGTVPGLGLALAAASLVDLAAALAGDRASGCRLVLDTIAHSPGKLDRDAIEAACLFADPDGDYSRLRAAGGDSVAEAWSHRRDALTTYRNSSASWLVSGVIEALWRDHCARALDVDVDLQRSARLIARRAARRLIALHGHQHGRPDLASPLVLQAARGHR